MMRSMTLALATALACSSALALNPGDRVENFSLLDQQGEAHELYYLSDMTAVVVMSHSDACASVKRIPSRASRSRWGVACQGLP
jgi:hypothetical protein